ncbi:hypothetical protein DFP72DRAFT_636552 [Ephemerocybe angulata]|uniref:Secreted protein n=1 Tax=Ephemerocybe angulata TaxID=980116 RepID=A0A8H6HHB2_9AGAR|nr:hypothetical protein DFP72DRAFT_636552 [Tulosesus angulatus]
MTLLRHVYLLPIMLQTLYAIHIHSESPVFTSHSPSSIASQSCHIYSVQEVGAPTRQVSRGEEVLRSYSYPRS